MRPVPGSSQPRQGTNTHKYTCKHQVKGTLNNSHGELTGEAEPVDTQAKGIAALCPECLCPPGAQGFSVATSDWAVATFMRWSASSTWQETWLWARHLPGPSTVSQQ